jgi:hypothetical protein
MNWQLTAFAFVYFATAAVAAVVAYLAHRKRSTPGANALAGLLLATAVWALADGLACMTNNLSTKIALSKISHIGIQALGVLFLLFVLRYTRRDSWLTPRRIQLLWIVPILALLLVFTNEWHGLIWPSVELAPWVAELGVKYEHGPAFWAAALYTYALMLIGSVVLVQSVLRFRDIYRQQAAVLLVAAFMMGLSVRTLRASRCCPPVRPRLAAVA